MSELNGRPDCIPEVVLHGLVDVQGPGLDVEVRLGCLDASCLAVADALTVDLCVGDVPGLVIPQFQPQILGVEIDPVVFFAVVVATHNHKMEKLADNSAAIYQIHGIDVSHHQGKINWDKVCRATLHKKTISFVFVKCSEGKTKLDKFYKRNREEVRKHHLKFGAYHFFTPGCSPREQALLFIHNSGLKNGDLRPVLDVENKGKISKQQLIEDVLEWLKIVGKHYNCMPILYTSHTFRTHYLNDERISHYPFWKAHYQVGGIITGKNWTFCQYSRRGRVAGIKDGKDNYVDLNVFKNTPENNTHQKMKVSSIEKFFTTLSIGT